jgi:predicted N-acetyltransferase YhbS
VAVAPGWQGRGVGEALVGTLMAQARRRGLREVCLLTTTAEGWFTRFGFERRERASVPPALRASAEFQGACPDGAVLMGLSLAGTASPAVAGTTACGCGTATASPPAPAPPDAPAARPCCCA